MSVHASPDNMLTTVVVHVSGLQWPTLVVAIAGVVLSLAALAWQAYSTLVIAGSRIEVDVRRGLMPPDRSGVLTFPDSAPEHEIEHAQSQGYTEPVYAVTANNTARGATTVVSVDLAFSDGGSYKMTTPTPPPLPYRLEGEDERTWYLDAGPVNAYAAASRRTWPEKTKNLNLRGRVILGSKKAIRSKNALAI
jgi:hypothetical protein